MKINSCIVCMCVCELAIHIECEVDWTNMHLNNHNKWHHSIVTIGGKLHLNTAKLAQRARERDRDSERREDRKRWHEHNNNNNNSILTWKMGNLFKSYANKQLVLVIHNQRMDVTITHTHITHFHRYGKVFFTSVFILFLFISLSFLGCSLVVCFLCVCALRAVYIEMTKVVFCHFAPHHNTWINKRISDDNVLNGRHNILYLYCLRYHHTVALAAVVVVVICSSPSERLCVTVWV